MKILYYNHLFRSEIGGGTHAREVFQSLEKLSGIEIDPFPPQTDVVSLRQALEQKGKLGWLPRVVQQWLRFWIKPLRGELGSLEKEDVQSHDIILFRPDRLMRLVPAIKKRFPDIHLCAEINSLVHSEGLKGVWPNWFWKRLEVLLINRADSVMVVSDHLKKELVQLGICEEKVLVNPNGVNLELFG